MKNTPVCIGSGLIALDVIYDNTKTSPSFLAGGSCGNVLTILSYLGWESYPIARLGDDLEGDRILEDMKKWGVKTKFIEQEDGTDSPRIIERIFRGKTPKHRFYLKCDHGNWLPRRKPFLLKTLGNIQNKIPRANVFYFDRATPSAYNIAKNLKNKNTIIVFEPPKFLHDNVFYDCLKIADIVKHCYSQAQDTEKSRINIPLEIQTKSEEGLQYKATFLKNKEWKPLPAVPVHSLVDAAGSGDWLTAGMIYMLRMYKSVYDIPVKKLEHTLNFGQALASLNCNYIGARGMMYHISKDKLIKLANKVCIDKKIQIIVKTDRRIHVNSKLASQCKVCLCAN